MVNITNEEFIRNMSKEELGDFLCSIVGRCKLCELRELCGKKYPKGYPDWLEDTYSGDITKGFHASENSLSGEIHDHFCDCIPLGERKSVNWIEKKLEQIKRKISELEKENNNMNSTTNLLGKSLFDTLKEQSERFNKWVTESEKYLSGISARNMDKEVLEENFGKKNANLGQAIIKESENFSNWIEMSTCLLCMLESMKKDTNNIEELNESLIDIEKVISAMEDENDKYSFVDSLEIDLRNNTYFDVSQWEGDVKPVKVILSICMPKETTRNVVNDIADNWNKLGKSSNFDVNLTIGNMIFIMEDGTFRTR